MPYAVVAERQRILIPRFVVPACLASALSVGGIWWAVAATRDVAWLGVGAIPVMCLIGLAVFGRRWRP